MPKTLSTLTPTQRARLCVRLGIGYRDLPLSDVRQALRLRSRNTLSTLSGQSLPPGDCVGLSTVHGETDHAVSLTGHIQRPTTALMDSDRLPHEDTLSLDSAPSYSRIPEHVWRYVLRETRSRQVAVVMRQAVANDHHDAAMAPRDTMAGKVKGEPRAESWTIDDILDSNGQVKTQFSGSAADQRQAIRDLASDTPSQGRQALLSAREWATGGVTLAGQETRALRRTLAPELPAVADEKRRKRQRKPRTVARPPKGARINAKSRGTTTPTHRDLASLLAAMPTQRGPMR